MATRKIERLVPALLEWYSANARDLPWRRTKDPYGVHVSEIMLQQTQVKTVIPYWERWMKALPTIASAAAAPSEQIHKLWEGLGYYTRVRNLQKAAQVIVARHQGKFPETFDAVLELPGIGRYTAGAICSIAFNQPTPILDGNVIRVLTRLFAIEENPKEKETNARLWELAEMLVKEAWAGDKAGARVAESHSEGKGKVETGSKGGFAGDMLRVADPRSGGVGQRASFLNQSLMELGALICTPRQPQCLICPVQKQCEAFRQQRTEELPNLGERTASTARAFQAFVLEHGGQVHVQQRPDGVVNAHLWEFPNIEITGPAGGPLPAEVFRSLFQMEAKTLNSLCVVKHSITRYRITLTAHHVALTRRPAKLKGVWVTPDQLAGLAFSSAHKKIVKAVVELLGNEEK